MKILISAANSDIALAIARIIKDHFEDVFLVGVTPDGCWPSKIFFDVIENICLASDVKDYEDRLTTIVSEHKIDLFIPVSEKELALFSQGNPFNLACQILVNPPIILQTCLDKLKTYSWLKSIGVPVPQTYKAHEKIDFSWPAIIKPRRSAGSKNLTYLNDSKSLAFFQEQYQEQLEDAIVQRCVGESNQEYTCALWRFKGDFRSLIFHRKLQGGLTGEACVVHNDLIEDVLMKLQKSIEDDFFINVQLRLENDEPYIFEINPRFSSTVMMRHKIGFQDVIWSICSVLNLPISSYKKIPSGIKIYRLSHELIVEQQNA